MQLVQSVSVDHNNEEASSGKMLLLALDSLFKSVDTSWQKLKMSVQLIMESPSNEALKIEVIKSTHERLENAFSPKMDELLELTVFLHQLVVIKELFSSCVKSMLCFKGDPSTFDQKFPTTEAFAVPLRTYFAEFYKYQLVGIPSFALAMLITEVISSVQPNLLSKSVCHVEDENLLEIEDLAKIFTKQQSMLSGNDKGHFLKIEFTNVLRIAKKYEIAKSLEQKVEHLQATQHINQMQRNSFQWFHHSHLPLNSITLIPPVKQNFLTELKNYVSVIMVLHDDVFAAQTKFQELYGTVEQRLKWACGANPQMQVVFENFLATFIGEMEMFKNLSVMAKAIASNGNTILQLESLISEGRESIEIDSAFMALLGDCQQSAGLRESQTHGLTEEELGLFVLNPPGEMINKAWIKETEKVISNQVKHAQLGIGKEQENAHSVVKEVQQISKTLKLTLTGHQKLMSDVGSLLRTISKSEDFEIPQVQAYLSTYKEFSDVISTIIGISSEENIQLESCRMLSIRIDALKTLVPQVYDDLVELAATLREENIENFRVKRGMEEEDSNLSNKRKEVKTSEEKNSFALGVLRRIKNKLDGREPDALKKSDISEQVDFIIREATSLDNLALMYEGWTAWI